MNVASLALALALVFTVPPAGAAQEKPATGQMQRPDPILGNCEDNIHYLTGAHHLAGPDSAIIAIARLGGGERRRALNRRRLHNVRVYLTEFDWHRAPETVVTAEGEPVKGYGRVELYVRGELLGILEVRRNQDLSVGSCEPDNMRPVAAERNFYPYLDKKPRKITKRY